MTAQLGALTDWARAKVESFADIRQIRQPTLVINGNDDIMVPTINSYHMAQAIPNAQLIIYPDAGHGSQYQYPGRFLVHVREFLDGQHDEVVAEHLQLQVNSSMLPVRPLTKVPETWPPTVS